MISDAMTLILCRWKYARLTVIISWSILSNYLGLGVGKKLYVATHSYGNLSEYSIRTEIKTCFHRNAQLAKSILAELCVHKRHIPKKVFICMKWVLRVPNIMPRTCPDNALWFVTLAIRQNNLSSMQHSCIFDGLMLKTYLRCVNNWAMAFDCAGYWSQNNTNFTVTDG